MWNINNFYTTMYKYMGLHTSLQRLWERPFDAREARIKFSPRAIARN